MVTKKDLVIAVLATFCLTATLFLIMPTRSSPQGYDPQVDINHDGVINILDIAAVAKAFNPTNTGNDPTLNVNVTNWQPSYALVQGTVNITSKGWSQPIISCGGYSRLSVLVNPTSANIGLGNNITITLDSLGWMSTAGFSASNCMSDDFPNDTEGQPASFAAVQNSTSTTSNVHERIVMTSFITEVKGPYCVLVFSGFPAGTNIPQNWWITFDYTVYLRNE